MPPEPMLAAKAVTVPDPDPNLVMELKLDGWRALYCEQMLSARSGKLITQVPYIEQALGKLPQGITLDGELVSLHGDPTESFKRTQSILKRDRAHNPTIAEPALTYVVFDILEVNGSDVKRQPLSMRREFLKLICDTLDPALIHLIEQFPVSAQGFDDIVAEGGEGVIVKRLDSTYSPGARGPAWIKVKPEQEEDVLITGMFEPDEGSRYQGRAVGGFTFEREGIPGRCGTGMNDNEREDMLDNPSEWIGKVAVVGHCGIAADSGAMRFPSFLRIREAADKPATSVPMSPMNGNKSALVERCLEAEEERDDYKAKYEDVRDRLQAMIDAVKPERASSGRTRPYKRNYDAMKDPNLRDAYHSLHSRSGAAYERVIDKGGDVEADLQRVEAIMRGRGMTV